MKNFMKKYGKWLSPSAFGIVIICFAMPLMGIECSGNQLVSVTGFDAAVSGVYPKHLDKKAEKVEDSDSDFRPPSFLMSLALLLFVCAGVAGIWRGSTNSVITIAVGAAGVLSVILFRIATVISFNHSMKADSGDEYEKMGSAMASAMVKLVWYYGFWFILIFGILGILTRVYFDKVTGRKAEASP